MPVPWSITKLKKASENGTKCQVSKDIENNSFSFRSKPFFGYVCTTNQSSNIYCMYQTNLVWFTRQLILDPQTQSLTVMNKCQITISRVFCFILNEYVVTYGHRHWKHFFFAILWFSISSFNLQCAISPKVWEKVKPWFKPAVSFFVANSQIRSTDTQSTNKTMA